MAIYRPIGDVYGFSQPGNLAAADISGASMQWSDDSAATYAQINPGDSDMASQARAPYGNSLQAAAGATELYISVFIDGGVSDDHKPTSFGITDEETFTAAVQDFSSLGSTTQGWVEFGPFTTRAASTSGLFQYGELADLCTASNIYAFFTGGRSGFENYTYITEFAVRLEGGAPPVAAAPLRAPALRQFQRSRI